MSGCGATKARPKRVVIFTAGTEGDARPFVALGAGLAGAGHEPVMCASREYEALIRRHGLGFAPLTADFQALMGRRTAVMDQPSQIKLVRAMVRETHGMSARWAEEGLAAARGADLVIGAGSVALLAASVAEALGIPYVRAQLQPLDPCRALPPVVFRPPPVPLPGAINLGLYHALRFLAWRMMRPTFDRVRRDLKLAPYPWHGPWRHEHGAGGRTLYGFSPHVAPPQPEWPERIAVPGYFVLEEALRYEPPAALQRFLAAGPPPIYVGFGSMISGQARGLAETVAAAARRAGRRAIIAGGWAGLGEGLAPDGDILTLRHVPHDWLFPRVALAVHHCGAGTAAAAARARVPTVPVPFIVDQFFWAWRLGRLGVAAPPLDRRRMTVERLAGAIEAASQPGVVARAQALGEALRREDGVAAAIGQLVRWGLLPAGASARLSSERLPPERLAPALETTP